MRVAKAEFIKSATKPAEYPPAALPEVAFVGRSNVGKSSLINAVTNKSKLAITSRTPGRTRLINFFNISDVVTFVDLPGYGFARASRPEREKWQRMIDAYLGGRETLAAMVVIIDVRHDASPLDEQMLAWLAEHDLPVIPVFTKADKLSRNQRKHAVAKLEKSFGIPAGGAVVFSAKTGQGVVDVWKCIAEATDVPLSKITKGK